MFKEIKECMACGSTGLMRYLDFGRQTLANDYSESGEKYPLEVMFCDPQYGGCSHSQLSIAVDPQELYKNYLYVNSSQTLHQHHLDLAYEFTPEFGCINVLDVGGNDGSLALTFIRGGNYAYVVDPSNNLKFERFNRGIPSVDEMFNSQTASKIKHRFDLITMLNVLPHGPTPLEMLEAAKSLLNKGGKILVECVYAKETLIRRDFGQFYHEHMNYFNVRAMQALCSRAGLNILDIEEFPEIHGGTIRFILGLGAQSNKVEEYKIREYLFGLQDYQRYLDFADDIKNLVHKLMNVLTGAERLDYPTYIYGASAKVATLLGWKPLLQSVIKGAIDNNPLKVGRSIPGTNIPILEMQKFEDKSVFIIGAHNFAKELKEKLKAAGNTGWVVNYVPSVLVEEL